MFLLMPAVAAQCRGQATGTGRPATAKASVAAKAPAATQTIEENAKGAGAGNRLALETVRVPSEVAEALAGPPNCDAKGNLYLKTTPDGVSAIHKLNSKGERIALFQPKSPGLQIDFSAYFSIGPDGDLYELVYPHEISRYVLVYGMKGNLKSTIKLQPGFAFMPYRLAVFPSGDLLVSGLEYDKDRNNRVMWPFNGIFSQDGTLRKELVLEDDNTIHDMAVYGDMRVISGHNPSSNHAVSWGSAETGPDGNVYLMRRLSPATFYAISADGRVVRRFTVDPGREDFMPFSMHIGGNRIAVLFHQPQTGDEIIKIVDLAGREISTYDESVVNGEQPLGLAFACYASNPERLTFFETTEDNKLELTVARPY